MLLDDGDSLRGNVVVARSLGIHTFLLPWQEAAPHLEQLGVKRSVPAGRGPQNRGGTVRVSRPG